MILNFNKINKMIKLLTYISGVMALLTVSTLGHVFIMYLIINPMPLKITAWVVVIVGLFKLLRSAINGFLQSDWLDNSFKSKSIEE